MAEIKNKNSDIKEDTKKKKSKRIIPMILWRFSGILLWLWFIDSIMYKLHNQALFNLPNYLLYLLLIVPIYCIFTKDSGKIILYPFYLFIFPFLGIYLIAKLFYYICKIINKIVKAVTRGIDLFSCTTAAILFFILFLINQVFIITNDTINLQIIFALLSLIFLFFLMISIIRWVHDPYRPLKNLQEIIINMGKKLSESYYKTSIEPVIEKKNSKKIKQNINSINSFIDQIHKVKSKLNLQINIPMKKRITGYSTIVFFLFLLIVLFGYAGSIMCLNRLAAENKFPYLLTVYNDSGSFNALFNTLPTNASYFDCVFQSFSIMTISQDFTLNNISNIGKILILLEIFTTIFVFTQLLSVFSTTIGMSDDVKILSTNDIFDKILKRLEAWSKELTSLELPESKEIKQEKAP